MKIFSKSKKPGREFVNLDGTPYENRFLHPVVRPFADFVSLPSAKIGVAAAFAMTAVEMCIVRDTSYLGPLLALHTLDAVGVQAIYMFIDRHYQNRCEKQKGSPIVIDKSGLSSMDDKDVPWIIANLRAKSLLKWSFNIGCVSVGMRPFSGATSAFLDWRMSNKLKKKEWTIVASPPKRQRQTSRAGLWGRLTAPKAG